MGRYPEDYTEIYTEDYTEYYSEDTSEQTRPKEKVNMKDFQNILEEHTEKTFVIDIMDVPGQMQSTLLRLLAKSKANNKDPLLKELNPKPTNYAGDLDVPNNMKGLNINYEIQLTVPDNNEGLNEEISGLNFPDRVSIPKDEKVRNLKPPRTKQDPLLRSLNQNENENIKGLSVPDKSVGDHLEDLKGASLPNDIVLDTITIEVASNNQDTPKRFERIRISENPRDPLDKQLREFPAADDYDDIGGAPEEHQNPLLRLVDDKSHFDANILLAPKSKQDPLLRQLRRHPDQFRDDFLQLPRRKQDTLLKILRQGSQRGFDVDQLIPPGYKQNPLLRLLQPSTQVIGGLSPPSLRQDPLLRQLRKDPKSYQDDFLDLPDNKQDTLLKVLRINGVSSFDIDQLRPPGYKQNPLIRLLQPHSSGEAGLSPPDLRQDPLLHQLQKRPEKFQDDFLDLPHRKQDTLLKVLRSNGMSRFDVNKLTPPGYKQNPLLRILDHNNIESLERDNLLPPPLVKEVMENPEEFKEDFRELSEENKVELLEMIDVFDTGVFKIDNLIGRKSERLEVVPHNPRDPLDRDLPASAQPDSFEALLNAGSNAKNPLLHFIEAMEDKAGVGAKYRKDPLLRQLRLNPESYQDDFLELPRRRQDTLLKLLRGDEGLEARIVERLVPPGQRQDPLLRALIAGDKGVVEGQAPPGRRGNPLLRILRPSGRDLRDRDNLTPPNYRQDPLLRQLRLHPSKFRNDFLDLPKEDQEELVEIIRNMETENFPFEELMPKKSGQLRLAPVHPQDPLGRKLPSLPQLDDFTNKKPSSLQSQLFGGNNEDFKEEVLTPPKYKQNPLLRQLLTEPHVYKDAFLELPQKEQETLLKILKKEGGEDFDISILIPPPAESDGSSVDDEALQLLSFYNWTELILARMNQQLFWEEIKTVLGEIIREKIGEDLQNPHKFSELLVNKEPEKTFKNQVESMMEKLKSMESTKPSPENFDKLMESLVVTAKEESKSRGEMNAKVAMVDNLVNLFIQGNALRAQKTNADKKSQNPLKLKTMKIIEELKKDLAGKEPKSIRIKPSRDSKRILIEKSKKRPNNYRDRTNGLRPPVRLHRPKDTEKEPMLNEYDITIGSRERDPIKEEEEDEEKKSAPLILDRNPLLRLLQPSGQDEADKVNLRAPNYRQDPLLRQLVKHPETFKEDFLELPSRKQDTLLGILTKEGGGQFDPSVLSPPESRQNPLLRLLKPTGRDKQHRDRLSPPSPRQDPLLRQLAASPQDYQEDFLSLPMQRQEELVELLEEESPGIVSRLAPLTLDRNPLLRLLEPTHRDEGERDTLLPPSYRQDPLLRQLASTPQDYNHDFLQLPAKQKAAVMEQLQEAGLPREAMAVIIKAKVMPSLEQLFEVEDKKEMSEIIFDMLVTDTEKAAHSFSELFEFSTEDEKMETIDEIIEMVDRDPTAVTSAFSDLIFDKVEQQKNLKTKQVPSVTEEVTIKVAPTTATTTTTQGVKTTEEIISILSTTRQAEETTSRLNPTTSTTTFNTPETTPKEAVRSSAAPTTTLKEPETTRESVMLKSDKEFLNGPREELQRELAARRPELEEEEEEIFTPEVPLPYEDPPEAVRGQLLRFSSKKKQERFGSERPSSSPGLTLEEDFNLPTKVLLSMQGLIEEGRLSREDVIEHLINNGFLPVEVTELGRIPITVGVSGGTSELDDMRAADVAKLRSSSRGQGGGEVEDMRSAPRRRPTIPRREQATEERLKELSTTSRIPFDEKRTRFEDVDISDPDFDFERVSPSSFKFDFNDDSRRQRPRRPQVPRLEITTERTNVIKTDNQRPASTTPATLKELEQVNAVMDMIKMFDDGQIDENTLLEMLGERGEAVVAGSGNLRPRGPTQITESPRSQEVTSEFATFNMDLRPVKNSFTNMNMLRGGRQQGGIITDDLSDIEITFPKEDLEPVDLAEDLSPPSAPMKPFTAFDRGPVSMVTPVPEIVHSGESLFYHDIMKDHFPAPVRPHYVGGHSPPPHQPVVHVLPLQTAGPQYGGAPQYGGQEYDVSPPHVEEGGYGGREFPEFTDFQVDTGPGLQELHHLQTDELWEGRALRPQVGPSSAYPEAVPPAYPPPLPVVHDYTHTQTHAYYSGARPAHPYTYLPTQDYRGQPYPSPQYPAAQPHPVGDPYPTHGVEPSPSPPLEYGAREPPRPSSPPPLVPDYVPNPPAQPEVKSLSEHPYGPYGERYAQYPAYSSPPPPPAYWVEEEQAAPPPPPSYWVEEEQAALPPPPSYWVEEEQASPLYTVHAPLTPLEHFHPDSSAFYPRSGQYGQRVRAGRQIPSLPDHTTLKPFAYEVYPVIPRTGHGTLDHTIEDIHQAFLQGDPIGHVLVKSAAAE